MSKLVAILGRSYRLPSTSSDTFDQDLFNGKNLISSVASDRWTSEVFSHPLKSHPGSAYTFAAGSVGDVSLFDAAFFGISPREAAQIDPQQRILLELSWEALEDAGIKPSSMRGKKCGVYIGIASADYSYRLAEDLSSIDSSVATGNTASISANRISYFFDLRGPSMAIDTACSSSLVAFHQACQAIRSGEITHALTGGISLHLHPYGFIVFSKASMLSPNGNCNVFDEAGDGYVRSEGAGIFVLKDYEMAVADGDPILAVVADTAVNTDGKKSGLTIPKPEAQAELLASSYAAAKISPNEISYIETHGTGTAVGDPIETLALGTALGQHRLAEAPLPIGSVKSNIGHLEAASGIAGLIKALVVIEHRKIPPTIGINKLNPRINFKELNLDVVTETREIAKNQPVIVGVNSFGFGGANAHVILRDHEKTKAEHSIDFCVNANVNDAQSKKKCQSGSLIPLLFSAATDVALKDTISSISNLLSDFKLAEDAEHKLIYDAAYQLAFRREALEHRAILFVNIDKSTNQSKITNSKIEHVSKQLSNFANKSKESALISGQSLITGSMHHGSKTFADGPVFLYSGNGSQWMGMGKSLFHDPVFKSTLLEIDQTFIELAGYSISNQLQGFLPDLNYENTDIAQPALFAVQVGITNMLAARGLSPKAVAGHSVGEVAAAWAAGILDLKSAVEVIFHRSRLQQTTKGRGNMSAVALDVNTAMRWLDEDNLSGLVFIAGVNSYRGITIAGNIEHLTAFESRLNKERIGFKRLDLDFAFHSPEMDGIETELEVVLKRITPKSGEIPFYSSVTGEIITGSLLTAKYWWKNIRQPVLFEQATKNILASGFQVLVEIGPHPVLKGYLNDSINQQSQLAHDADKSHVVLPSLSRNQDDIEAVQRIVAHAWIAGTNIDLSVYFPKMGQHTKLPSYPWQKERHWHSISTESPNTLNRLIDHPLLGYRLPLHDLLWENQLDPYKQSFLADHVVGDAIVFPGTGYIELALAAAKAWHEDVITTQIEDLEILTPITFNSGHTKVLRVGIDSTDGRVLIQTRELLSNDSWTLNARARIILEARFPIVHLKNTQELELLNKLSVRQPDFDGRSHISLTRQVGLEYGEAFDAIKHGWLDTTVNNAISNNDSVTALFNIPEKIVESLNQFHIHPAILDCSFQLIIQILRDKIDLSEGIAFVPTQIGRISLQSNKGKPHHVKVRLLRKLTHSLLAEFNLYDSEGHPILCIESARFRRIRLQKINGNAPSIQDIHTHYIPLPLQPGMHLSHVNYPQILESANEVARRNVMDRNYRSYVDELDPLLDALCNSFALESLIKLGFTNDTSTNSKILYDLFKKSPTTSGLLKHVLQLCVEDGKLIEEAEGFKLVGYETNDQNRSNTEEIGALKIWNTLVEDYPDYFSIIHSVGKVGQHLSQILSGEQSLHAVLGKTSSIATLTDVLVGNVVKSRFIHVIRTALNHAHQKLSPGERLGLLEVAAFTPTVAWETDEFNNSNQCDVVFACPNISTLENVHYLVDALPNLRLDGFQNITESDLPNKPSSDFQVDLAIVWLHFDTSELNNQAISYSIRHLKPGGTLFVIGQHRTHWLDFTFGAQANWWVDNVEKKQISMQCDRSVWESKLGAFGLENIHHTDTTHKVTAGAFVLLAQKPLSAKTQKYIRGLPRSWLLLDDESAQNQNLRDLISSGLQERGDIVSILRQENTNLEIEDISNHLISMSADFGEIDGIIHIKGMGAAYIKTDSKCVTDRCTSASNLMKACQRTNTNAPIWFITQKAHSLQDRKIEPQASITATKPNQLDKETIIGSDSMFSGFIRTLKNEFNANRLKQIDLNTNNIDQDLVQELIDELTIDNSETEVVLTTRHGRFVPRLHLGDKISKIDHISEKNNEFHTFQLNFSQPGQLRNLEWQTVPRKQLADDEVEIQVEATGLNFRDVMYALGLLSDEAIENGFAGPTIGLECAGKIIRFGKNVSKYAIGDRVVGFGSSCFANRVVTKAAAVSYIPRSLSFEAAATIPSTFLTSYYALVHLGRLAPGEKILIHGAAGGVGLAAIQIARWCGAKIYATAGSNEKRQLLHMMGVDYVLDSRSLSFAEDIMSITQGTGIDMVLNSLAGEAINRNLSILKPFGRFLELGKRDFYENTRVGLRPFRNNITYFGIDADQLMNERPELTAKIFNEVMGLFETGILHALPYNRFEARDIVDAFRFMQQSLQIGKIIVTYQNGIPLAHTKSVDPLSSKSSNKTRLKLDHQATYLITGGLGGFGLRTALWLAEKGARHLILLGRRGPNTDEARQGIESLMKMGVEVTAKSCDITDVSALSSIIKPLLPKLKGIVHAAAVIEDSLIENLTPEQFERVLRPKVTGALNLHSITREQPLDFFVMYSSATTLFGNPGQAAYVTANSGLEALANYRRVQGLPATCILWGAIDDVGFLAQNKQIKEALLHRMGGNALTALQAFDILEKAILQNQNNVGFLDLDFSALSKFLPSAQSPIYSELARHSSNDKNDDQNNDDIPKMLRELDDIAIGAVFMELIKNELSQILRIAPEKIDTHKSIYDMGLDSLMGVELVTALESRFNVRLTVMSISENPTIDKLTQRLISILRAQMNASVDANHSANTLSNTHAAQITELAKIHGANSSVEEITELAESLNDQSNHQPGKFLQ